VETPNVDKADEPQLTVLQAYDAMLCFLTRYPPYSASGDLSDMLNEISYGSFEDGVPLMTVEQGAWSDWLECVGTSASETGHLSALQTHDSMRCFLRKDQWSASSDVSNLVDEISYRVIEDGVPSLRVEQGVWSFWLECVEAVLAGKFDALDAQRPA